MPTPLRLSALLFILATACHSGNPGTTAPADQTATFALPNALTAGTPWIQLEARPPRGAGESAVSEQFPVKQGDEITWSVPAQ